MFEVHTVRDRVEGVGRVGGLEREGQGEGGYAEKVQVGGHGMGVLWEGVRWVT